MHSPQELVSQVSALASLPSVYVRIREIVEAPDSSMASIAGAISSDPALCARLLKQVNSAAYRHDGLVDSIGRAISMLGLERVHDLVLAMSLCTVFEDMRPRYMDMQRFWRGSVMRGLAARNIGEVQQRNDTERLFVCGLMSDLGHLVMYQTVPNLAEAALLTSRENNEPRQQVERRIVGCDHAEVGAALLGHWRLPACFTDPIAAQHHPQMGGEYSQAAAIVQLADYLAEAEQKALEGDIMTAPMPAPSRELLTLPPEKAEELRRSLDADLAIYLQNFAPRSAHS